MLLLVVIILVTVVAALALANMRAPRPATAQAGARRAAAASPAAQMHPTVLEWGATIAPPESPGAGAALACAADRGEPAMRAKIRDRYVAVRFPGIAQSSRDLEKLERVIPAARLFFEEGHPDRALELLQLAIKQCPTCEPIRLAQLEIAFLARDKVLFNDRARDFNRVLPASPAWSEVSRLGRALSPGEALYGPAQGPRGTEHFGPWPDMPNWIRASWDLTAEVLACDFHQAMKRSGAAAGAVRMPAAEEILS